MTGNIKSGVYSASGLVAITPNNTNDLPAPVRALWVGTGGDIKIQGPEGGAEVLKNVSSGQMLAVQTVRVFATETTATDIVGLF